MAMTEREVAGIMAGMWEAWVMSDPSKRPSITWDGNNSRFTVDFPAIGQRFTVTVTEESHD